MGVKRDWSGGDQRVTESVDEPGTQSRETDLNTDKSVHRLNRGEDL